MAAPHQYPRSRLQQGKNEMVMMIAQHISCQERMRSQWCNHSQTSIVKEESLAAPREVVTLEGSSNCCFESANETSWALNLKTSFTTGLRCRVAPPLMPGLLRPALCLCLRTCRVCTCRLSFFAPATVSVWVHGGSRFEFIWIQLLYFWKCAPATVAWS